MKSIACTITYGKTNINYELLVLDRRSLEISVHPDKSVVVKAPKDTPLDTINERVKKRAHWIKRQIAYFSQFEPRTPDRRFVGGESHMYLGKKYRLKIQDSARDKVLLKNGYFHVECTRNDPSHIRRLIEKWYRRYSTVHLSKIFEDCWEAFSKKGYAKPKLEIRKMEKRWGSLSVKGRLTLNVNLVQTPRECIEYVIIHELCHLMHHNHGAEFYKLLNRMMPDWMKRKHKLEMTLV